MKRTVLIIILLPTVIVICVIIGFKNLNRFTVFLHDNSDMKIEEVNINTTVSIDGTLIDNGYFTVTIPNDWTYSDWRDDLTNPVLNLRLEGSTEEQYLSEFHGARAVRDGVWDYLDSGTRDPAMVSFSFRPAIMRNNNTLLRDLKPCENVSITVNGREWTGFHGLDKINSYRCCLECIDEDGWILAVSINKGRSNTFTLEDKSLLIFLASMQHNDY